VASEHLAVDEEFLLEGNLVGSVGSLVHLEGGGQLVSTAELSLVLHDQQLVVEVVLEGSSLEFEHDVVPGVVVV